MSKLQQYKTSVSCDLNGISWSVPIIADYRLLPEDHKNGIDHKEIHVVDIHAPNDWDKELQNREPMILRSIEHEIVGKMIEQKRRVSDIPRLRRRAL